jgi:hypothetical protein
MLMPLAGRSRVDESRCHTGYTGHYSLVGTYSRLRSIMFAHLCLPETHQVGSNVSPRIVRYLGLVLPGTATAEEVGDPLVQLA